MQHKERISDAMYNNLDKTLKENAFSFRAAAAAIGMSEATFRNKMNGGSFSIGEAFDIRERLLPRYDIYYLFAEAPADTAPISTDGE